MVKKLLQLTSLCLFLGVSSMSAQELIITEFLQSSTTADNTSEYIEIYNTTNADIVLDGAVQYAISKEGSGNKDLSGTVPANGFFILGRAKDAMTPHTNTIANAEYIGVNLSGADTIQLFKTEGGVETLVDAVTYISGSSGVAYIYKGLASEDNSDAAGSLWGAATVREGQFVTGAGESTDLGSPGINGTGQILEGALTYTGGAWTPSAPDATTTTVSAVIVDGTASFNTPVIANDFQIRSGATLEIAVGGTLDFEGTIINDGLIRFKSDATGSGELERVANSAEISGTGEVEVERYFSNNRAYRMVSPGVTTTTPIFDNWQEGGASPAAFGTHITGSTTGANGFDATTTGNPSLFTLNVGDQAFEAVPNTDVLTLDATEAYLLFVRGDRNVTLGDNTSISETVIRTRGALTLGNFVKTYPTAAVADFIMVGNPYQTVTRADLVLNNAGTSGLNVDQIYIFDPTLASGSGAYETVNLASPMGSDFANRRIAPGIAFQVEVATAGAPLVQFQENDKDAGATAGNTYSSSNDELPSIVGELFTTDNFNAGNTRHDRFTIQISDTYTNEVNLADAVKVRNFKENMAIATSEKNISLERRASIEEGQTIQLYNDSYENSDYTLTLKFTDILTDDLEAVFVDSFTGTETILSEGENVINFSVETQESKADDRFSILFRAVLSVDEATVSSSSLYPNPLNNNDKLSVLVNPELNGQEVNISITNLLGQIVLSTDKTFEDSKIELTIPQLGSGIYLVNVSNDSVKFTKKLIKQ